MTTRTMVWMAAAAATLAMASARAQALTDPTRPPQAIAPGDAPQEAGGTQLQSVLISPRRRLAIINGAMVSLGDTVGEAKVVKITETEVVLRKDGETEVLKLFPGVDKQAARRSSRQGRAK
ncbi:MAG: MSHA biogenesis protein MshK [Pseudomonadota bacterium]